MEELVLYLIIFISFTVLLFLKYEKECGVEKCYNSLPRDLFYTVNLQTKDNILNSKHLIIEII